MSVFLNNGVSCVVNSVDLSDHVQSLTINRNFSELDITAMGDSGMKRIKGLEDSSISIDFLNDTAASKVLATLQAAWGTSINIVVKQTSAAVSATNPSYTASCLINGTTDVNGAVGDVGIQSCSFNVQGTIAVATT